MSQGYLHEVGDDEIRDSIRVMKQQRTTRLLLVILATILGISVLFVAAYLGFTT